MLNYGKRGKKYEDDNETMRQRMKAEESVDTVVL